MPRLMSFAITTRQARERTKFVTRRKGWDHLKVGEKFWMVEKCMGLKKGEHVNYIHLSECISKRKETLSPLLENPEYGSQEMILEGFPGMEPAHFIAMFMKTHKGVTPVTPLNRIEFRYLD